MLSPAAMQLVALAARDARARRSTFPTRWGSSRSPTRFRSTAPRASCQRWRCCSRRPRSTRGRSRARDAVQPRERARPGSGLGETVHVVPLYRSTSVFCAVAVGKSPTAKQLVRLGQATPVRWLSTAPAPVRTGLDRPGRAVPLLDQRLDAGAVVELADRVSRSSRSGTRCRSRLMSFDRDGIGARHHGPADVRSPSAGSASSSRSGVW